MNNSNVSPFTSKNESLINNSLIQQNIPLADKTWFKTGGNARFFAQPTTPQEFTNALIFAQVSNLSVFMLGTGANILISDDGFDGLVIRPGLNKIEIDQTTHTVTAQAGVSFPDLILYCLDHHLTGLEEFAGIPGTVGGSVYINIHYFEFLLSQFLVKATVIERKTGKVLEVTPEWFNFGYNQSTLLNADYYLVDATFQLKKSTESQAAYAKGRHDEIIRHRNRRYPLARTCGSFFRNFYPEELTGDNKLIFVAHYFESLGFKGQLRLGGASVFARHANMIVTEEGATSSDVIAVVRTMQERTLQAYGLLAQPECQLVGFKTYPLLTA